MDITGDFETHLTVAATAESALRELRAFALGHGLKITHIVLSCGRQPSQLMLTGHGSGTLVGMVKSAHGWAESLADRGLEVCRIKVEIDAQHPAAPSDKAEAETKPEEWHFEHHLKCLLPSPDDHAGIREIARRNEAYLSRNAFRVRPDGKEERFLTQRFYATGRIAAQRAFNILDRELEISGITILDREMEYVVFDSNVSLDAGWLDVPQFTSRC